MGYTAYLLRGSRRINLDASPYTLALGFVPPSITETPNVASGTSANQYGGSKLISKKVESSYYTFTVRVLGTNNAAIEANITKIDNFLRSGTTAEPVYFCWKANNNVSFEPTIGWWGSTFRAQVITGNAYKSMEYYGSQAREKALWADVSLLINPPEWPRRLLASATGGIIEDTIGTADGSSRGIMLPKATTNKATNPVFGHGTPLDDWTTAAGLVSAVNTDKNFILFGDNSAKVTRIGSSNLQFYLTLNVGNTNAHAFSIYAKKEDGSAITTDDINLYYNTTITTAFLSVGDGWYRLTATANGIASDTTSGVIISRAGQTIYLDGYQVEERNYSSAMCYGDALGCAWTGTAHASTSSRGASGLALTAAGLLNLAEGTITVSWKPSVANTFSADMRIFQNGATSFRALFQASDDKIYFLDNTNTAGSTDAQTFAAGDDIELAFTWHPTGGLKIYRAGVQIGSNATYTPPTLGADLWVGSTQVPDENIVGTVRGFTCYPRAMTAAEVLADYTARASAAAADLRVDWLTYIWTKDGDNVVDNCTDATRNNFLVVDSVPGSMPADTEIVITPSAEYTQSYLALNPVHKFTYPTSQTYYDASGATVADTSGGEAQDMNSSYGYAIYTPADPTEFTGNIYFLARALHDTGPNYVNAALTYTTGLTSSIEAARTDPITCPDDTTYNLYYLGHLSAEYNPDAYSVLKAAYEHGSGAEELDYFMAIPGYLTAITNNLPSVATYFKLRGTGIWGSATGYMGIVRIGDVIEVRPGKVNVMYYLQGTSTDVSTITSTAAFVMYIAPRWALA